MDKQKGMKDIGLALKDCNEQKQAILDGSNDIIVLLDSNLNVVWANSRARNICDDPAGMSCQRLFCRDAGSCRECVIPLTFRNSEKSSGTHESIVVTGKNDVFFKITALPVGGINGFVERVIVIAQDVTEKLRLEKQLKHASKMEAIGTLAGGIAHDFNNILTPIMGYAEIMRLNILQGIANKDDSVNYIDQIILASKRAQKLVQQILTFSRSGEGQQSLQEVHPIVKEGLKLIYATIPSSVEIKAEIDENCGAVSVDPVEIHQVLINLCTNAADAMSGTTGTMNVILRQREEPGKGKKWVELTVRDDGCGIDQDQQERIFDPYFTTKEKVQGTGMGLAVVHGIVNRCKGKIHVESEMGRGTSVTVSLPIVEDGNEYEKLANIDIQTGGDHHILLVDDEKSVALATAEMLRKFGYKVTEMTSAREALLTFHENPSTFDLVITDLTMPYMNGIELCKEIKEIEADLPVLLYSGAMEKYSEGKAIQAGIDGFCLKPLTMSEMAKAIQQLLN